MMRQQKTLTDMVSFITIRATDQRSCPSLVVFKKKISGTEIQSGALRSIKAKAVVGIISIVEKQPLGQSQTF